MWGARDSSSSSSSNSSSSSTDNGVWRGWVATTITTIAQPPGSLWRFTGQPRKPMRHGAMSKASIETFVNWWRPSLTPSTISINIFQCQVGSGFYSVCVFVFTTPNRLVIGCFRARVAPLKSSDCVSSLKTQISAVWKKKVIMATRANWGLPLSNDIGIDMVSSS